jgi:tetratricopeptide (TPR) repeat protein
MIAGRIAVAVLMITVGPELRAQVSRDTPPRQASVSSESVDQLVDRLAALLEQNQLAPAREIVTGALRAYPSNAVLHDIAGVIDAREGATASAERHFRAAISADPRMASAYLNLGRLYQEQARADPAAPRKALDVYQNLLRVDSTNPEGLYQAAYLSATFGDWRYSQDLLSRLPPVVSGRPQALAVATVDAAGLGDRARVDALASTLLAHPELSEQDVLAIVPALHRANDDALLVQMLTALDRRGLTSTQSLRHLGLSHARQNRLAEAREVLERAVRSVDSPAVPMLLDVARVAYKQGDFEGAIRRLARARDLDPQNAQVHFLFGLACIGLNLGSEAYESLKKAVALAPDNPYVNYAMGAVAIHRHEPSEALPYFEAYVRLQPDDPRGRFALGAARFYSNEFEEARADLERAATAPETAAGAHYFLARIARQLNDNERARQEIERALKLNPQHADGWAELGLLQMRSGQYDVAERSLGRALSLDPENYAATANLAALYVRTKDPRRNEQATRLDALQKKRAVAAQEFLRIIQVVQ